MDLNFEWDEEKAKANLKRHKISFDEAKTVFDDPFTITIDDPKHSRIEERFVDIGTSTKGRILVVVYTQRGDRIRLISGRKATEWEREIYEEKRF
ncbi:MAG: BrnT family toxin [Acidobacteria bacterium]|nr:BrnT family toxin [Acidobacteriota bacterium]